MSAREDAPTLVGVIAQETARYSMFAASLTSLSLPPGSQIKWWFGHSIADNCNALVREMFRRDLEALWLLGDDHAFSGNLLTNLLAHGQDIVVPLCLMRAPPYRPVIYRGFADEETYTREHVALDDHPDGGLIPIHSAGSGGMLIRREVFEAMDDPWFEAKVLDGTQLGEDLYFCDKAREAGASLYCDLDSAFGHCLSGVVWPIREHDGWTYGFSLMGGYSITMPPGAGWELADKVARGTPA